MLNEIHKTFCDIWEEFNSIYLEPTVSLENLQIEHVKVFRYLGDEVKFDEPTTGDAEIYLQFSIPQGKFFTKL